MWRDEAPTKPSHSASPEPMLRAPRAVRPARRRTLFDSTTALTGRVRSAERGDVYEPHLVRLEEMRQSRSRILRQALDRCRPSVRSSRAHAGAAASSSWRESYMRQENPRGEYGHLMVSDGDRPPTVARERCARHCFRQLSSLKPQVLTPLIPPTLSDRLGSIDRALSSVDRLIASSSALPTSTAIVVPLLRVPKAMNSACNCVRRSSNCRVRQMVLVAEFAGISTCPIWIDASHPRP